MRDEQLKWLQYNRVKPEHRGAAPGERRLDHGGPPRRGPTLAGPMANEILERQRKTSAVQQRIAEILATCADGDLWGQVTIGDVRDGVLTLKASNPSVLYALRVRWERRVLELMQAHLPSAGISGVKFSLARRA